MKHEFELEEGDRQMVVLAIAELALSRPGWDDALRRIARTFEAEPMFEQLKKTSAEQQSPPAKVLLRMPKEETNMKPTIGRIVHFVQEKPPQYQSTEGPKVLVHIPAIITAVWGDTCVNLQAFTDGSNSEIDGTNFRSVKWITSVTLDDSGTQPRTWHWPERE
jgi:hypothetical protein